jgi:hypothetical protein
LRYVKNLIVTALIIIVFMSIFIAIEYLYFPKETTSAKPFFLGIEVGWAINVSNCKTLIDKVKDYNNLIILASPLILIDEALLNQICDYAYNAGMYFMPVYYEDLTNSTNLNYTISSWFYSAKERYGDYLLGLYYYDEPAGSQLDMSEIIPNPILTSPPKSYLDYSNYFFWLWNHGAGGIKATANFTQKLGSSLFTSDYALYWFDYKLGYDIVFAQFGWNNSVPLQIALIKGAATVQNKNWGAIITWTYDKTPYLESAEELYDDMVLAYNSGANYIVVYDSSLNYKNSTLTDEHYTALKDFWSYVKNNIDKHGSLKADVAIVLPQDYAFGFRSPDDSVWQNHQPEVWTRKMYSTVTDLLYHYNNNTDIVYDDQQWENIIQSRYSQVFFWPKDLETTFNYTIIDLNNGLGFNSIQEAALSYATNQGDIILIRSLTYKENFEVIKPLVIISQNNESFVLEILGDKIYLTVTDGHLSLTT